MAAKAAEETGECRKGEEMTNADKIRSMTDEELIPVVLSWVCHNYFQGMKACPQAHCDDCIRQWLKQECEENDEIFYRVDL